MMKLENSVMDIAGEATAEEPLDDAPQRTKTPQQITVVAMPLTLYSEILEKLSEMPFKDVGKLMNQLSSLQPQKVEVR